MKCTAFKVDSEKRMPLFATIPSGMLYSDAKPVTIVGPYSFLNSKNRLPSTIRAMSSRTSKLFFVSFGMIPAISAQSNSGSSIGCSENATLGFRLQCWMISRQISHASRSESAT